MIMAAPRVLVLPYPAQGHVIPMMELSHCLIEHGVKVTFVNTELNHGLILGALATWDKELGGVDMVSIPDGLGSGEDRKDLARLTDSLSKVMPGELEKLIVASINADELEREKVSWLIADVNMAWAFPVAKKHGLRTAGFCPSSAAMFAMRIKIPEMISDGVLDERGWPKRRGKFQLAPSMPAIDTSEFSWNRAAGDAKGQPIIFQLILRNNEATDLADTIVCNSVQELEPGALALFPGVLPVGPLSVSSDKPAGSFWAADASCAAWLDAQPASSVVYVAFGSLAAYDAAQLVELAEGLLLTSRPFLCVVRPGSAGEQLRRRAAPRGRVVSWCPQQSVLAHPAVACFLTHCGWNSTMEAVRNGVPLLCWPYFTDQFLNQSYICDVWGTGLKVPLPPPQAAAAAAHGTGLVGRDVVRDKIEELLRDSDTKARALALRDLARRAVGDGGSSRQNLRRFLNLVRGLES